MWWYESPVKYSALISAWWTEQPLHARQLYFFGGHYADLSFAGKSLPFSQIVACFRSDLRHFIYPLGSGGDGVPPWSWHVGSGIPGVIMKADHDGQSAQHHL